MSSGNSATGEACASGVDLSQYDEEQVRLMAEECILIDENDAVTGHASKKHCHLMENIEKGVLHRAFSVFLFNSEGKLLLQQRSPEKITFPECWTNTCCSHPLYRPEELIEDHQQGVRFAARRKLQHELSIDPSQINLEDFIFLTRIHYLAPSDGLWGEHESTVLFTENDLDHQAVPNEVKDTKWVSQEELREFMATAEQQNVKITPWFRLIVEKFIYKWWSQLENLDTSQQNEIHRM
eukprot:gene11221-7830_t